ncbi:uncharacterized protein LOC126906660 [Daktulosphaira vitifoliae]|uniref:uncharacterized protein LOC126906660 n=1 Tax=Daktulosphaira vitifoliae TaxID=58002 RepID=UPI0021AA8314|nr:uncharacterized protein LOC126906660 [Daktulosphaira vitifoliae]XP_050543334.1 uncharacterized protein LOC126906660 [Daktulosphaira vitifoliae]
MSNEDYLDSSSYEDDNILKEHVNTYKLFRQHVRLFLEDTKAELSIALGKKSDSMVNESFLRGINDELEVLIISIMQVLKRKKKRNKKLINAKIWTVDHMNINQLTNNKEIKDIESIGGDKRNKSISRNNKKTISKKFQTTEKILFTSENCHSSSSELLNFQTSDELNLKSDSSDSFINISNDVIFHIRTPVVAQYHAKRKRDINDTEDSVVQEYNEDSVLLNNQYSNNQRFYSNNAELESEHEIKLPSFLASLKPKKKKLCQCGLTEVRVPLKWSQKLHDELHANATSLVFSKQMLPDGIKQIKRPAGLSYTILRFDNSYHDKNIAGIRRYASLELGISESGVRWFQRTVFISVLMPSDTKVIGYLEVEPAQFSKQLNTNGTLSELQHPVKYGISKIWVHTKYRFQHVGTSMIDFFRLTYSLTKDDIAFASHDIQNIKFLQKYKSENPVLIYTESRAWNR